MSDRPKLQRREVMGQYLETPPDLEDREKHGLTLTADGKLRVDDPTTQAAIADVETALAVVDGVVDDILLEVAGLDGEAMRGTDGAALAASWTAALATALGSYTAARAAYLDQLDFNLQEAIAALQTDLDNPAQYRADLTGLAQQATLLTVAGYIDTEITAIINALTTAQADLDNPAQYKADLTGVLALLESDVHGLAALKTLIDAVETKLNTPANFMADVSALALEATLTAIKGAGWSIETLKAIYDFIGINHTLLGDIDTEVGAIETKLDTPANFKADVTNLDVAVSTRLASAAYTAERGTDNALLAASYVTERGTDNAELESSALTRYNALIAAIAAAGGAPTGAILTTQTVKTGSGWLIGAYAGASMYDTDISSGYLKVRLSIDGGAVKDILALYMAEGGSSSAMAKSGGGSGIGLNIRYASGFTPSLSMSNINGYAWNIIYMPD